MKSSETWWESRNGKRRILGISKKKKVLRNIEKNEEINRSALRHANLASANLGGRW